MESTIPSKISNSKVNPKPLDQSSLQIYNRREDMQKEATEKGEEESADPYSNSYLWFDLSLLHPCRRKRDQQLKHYIQEKNKIENKLDVVDLIFAIETLKASVENLKHQNITQLNTYDKFDSHVLTKETNRDKHFDFKRRNYSNLSKLLNLLYTVRIDISISI